MLRRLTVQSSAVPSAEDYTCRHNGNDLAAAAHPAGVALCDNPFAQDLPWEGVKRGMFCALRSSISVPGVLIRTPVTDPGPEYTDTFFCIRYSRRFYQFWLPSSGLSDLGSGNHDLPFVLPFFV